MSEENDGVLGNLPRSRPGVRSDKRTGAARSGGPGGSAGSPPASKRGRAAKPRPKAKAAASARKTEPTAAPSPPPERPTDPIGMALKAGETVAITGIKVAGRVAGEVMRRLPRP